MNHLYTATDNQVQHSAMDATTSDNNSALLQHDNINHQNNRNEFVESLEFLRERIHQSDALVRDLQEFQEAFVLQYQARQKVQASYNVAARAGAESLDQHTIHRLVHERDTIEAGLRDKANQLSTLRINFLHRVSETAQHLYNITRRLVDDELEAWKRRQQLSGNGGDFHFNNLDDIERWCSTATELTWATRKQLRLIEQLCFSLPMNSPLSDIALLGRNITMILEKMITKTFVIAKQPPQVMKTNTKFTATLRFLVGNKLNVHLTAPTVRAVIISENQANTLVKAISNHKANLPTYYQQTAGAITAGAQSQTLPRQSLHHQDMFSHHSQQQAHVQNSPLYSTPRAPNDMTNHFGVVTNGHTARSSAMPTNSHFNFGQIESSGEILNSVGTMDFHPASSQLSCEFRQMQLKKIKRAEKRGTESVMDEKFTLLFYSTIRINDLNDEHSSGRSMWSGGDLTFDIWTMSLPVVVIVHGNQEPHAWATAIWDNAFAEPNRAPFLVPDRVLWTQLADVLSLKFETTTKRRLNDSNLRFLAAKAMRLSAEQLSALDYQNLTISWAQFAKEPLPERTFTFWEWFFAILKMTREHLRDIWNDGYIYGFVSREDTREMLLNCRFKNNTKPNSIFLLRFSETELGGLTIAWVSTFDEQSPLSDDHSVYATSSNVVTYMTQHTDGSQTGDSRVLMLQPFTSRDFAIRSLANRLKDLQNLTYLYPNIPKDTCFGKYYTAVNEQFNENYIQPVLVTQIPSRWSSSTTSSNPGSVKTSTNSNSSLAMTSSECSTPSSFTLDSPGELIYPNNNSFVGGSASAAKGHTSEVITPAPHLLTNSSTSSAAIVYNDTAANDAELRYVYGLHDTSLTKCYE